MIRRFSAIIAFLAAISLGLLSCSDDSPPVGPESTGQWMYLHLSDESPHPGAVLISVTTDAPLIVTYRGSPSGYVVYPRQVSDQEVRLIVIGLIGADNPSWLATFWMSGFPDQARYRATVIEATGADGMLLATSSYRLSLSETR